jgi:CBS domain-containing protein
MNLSEMFRSAVVTVGPNDTGRVAAEKMRHDNVGAVVVTEGKAIVGILTDRDLAMKLALGEATPETPIKELMTKKVVTIWDDQGVFNATQYLLGHKVRRLPIIDRQNTLIGMVTIDDLFALLARELGNLAKAIEPALGTKSF